MAGKSGCIGLLVAAALLGGCASMEEARKTPLDLMREAEKLSAKGHYEEALKQLKAAKESFRTLEGTAQAELKIADVYFDNEQYIEAAAEYQTFRKLHPSHEKAPYALFRTGLCNFRQIEGTDRDQSAVRTAAGAFDAYLKAYPNGDHAAEAREKLADCSAKMAEYEIYVGRFYYRSGKYAAAIQRLEDTLRRNSGSGLDKALYYLGASYLKNAEKEKGVETLNRLCREYSGSDLASDARKLLAEAKQ